MLNKLDVSKATGQDGISARFLKDSSDVIVTPMSYIINLSLELSEVPSDFKVAKVIPLYKKGEKSYEGNFRPVSILPVISKIFERVVYNQLNVYLSSNNVLYKNQSGFREGYSTETALICLSDMIRKNMDSGKLVGVILLDLQKAFDTVNHSILLDKLKCVGLN